MKKFIHIWAVAIALMLAPWMAASAADMAPATVNFEVNKSEIPAAAADVMKAAVAFAKANAGTKFQISGFTDKTGDPEKNKELAKARAFAVRDALKAAGVAEDKIELKKPEDLTAGATSAAEGRRVEVSLQ